jgi:hypothetical protein
MNNQTTIILVVVAVLVIGAVLYTSSQQAKKDRELQMQIAAMNNQPQEEGGLTGLISSLGDIGSLFGTIGGLFGGGESVESNEGMEAIFPMQERAVNNSMDYLQAKVETGGDLCSCESML